MGEWSNLTQREKSNIIRFAIKNGVSDINTIRDTFNVYISGNGGENEYKEGGSIHIKHPGRLTALKERTGKTEAELWATGNAHTRKMITFARNARKWHKHENGGSNWLPDFAYNPSIQSDNGRQLVQSVLQDESIQRAVQQRALQRQAEIEAQRKAVSEIYNGMPNPGAGYISGADPLMQAIVDMTPAGDAEMATEAASELRNGNLKEAGLLGAVLLLPNIFNKGIKEWRAARVLKQDGKKYTDNVIKFLETHGGRSKAGTPLSEIDYQSLWGDTKEYYDIFKANNMDLSRLTTSDISRLKKQRLLQLSGTNPNRFVLDSNGDNWTTDLLLYDKTFGYHPVGKMEYGFENSGDRIYNNHFGIEPKMIENLTEEFNNPVKGVSRDLYDAAIQIAKDKGYEGLISGRELLEAEKTRHIWEKYYPNSVKISDGGIHHFARNTTAARKETMQPIMLLHTPSKKVLPIKSSVFHPSILTNNGEMIIDWAGDRLHSTGGPLYPFSFQKNPYWKTPIVRY